MEMQNQSEEDKMEAWQIALILLENIARKINFEVESEKSK